MAKKNNKSNKGKSTEKKRSYCKRDMKGTGNDQKITDFQKYKKTIDDQNQQQIVLQIFDTGRIFIYAKTNRLVE